MNHPKIFTAVILSGRKEIGEFIRESPSRIGHLVHNEDLPAWKRSGGKSEPWKALPGDLEKWVKEQGKKYKE